MMEEVAVLFYNADYYGVVNHETTRKLLTIPWQLPANTKQGLTAIREGVAEEIIRCLQQEGGVAFVVMVGGALLQLFCTANWTGPPLTAIESLTNEDWQQLCLEELSIGGEEVYPLTNAPMLLWLSHVILVDNGHLLKSCDYWPVWSMRCLFTWQRLLGERVPSLWDNIEELMKCWNVIERNDKCEQLLEMGHMSLYYLQYDKAELFQLFALVVKSDGRHGPVSQAANLLSHPCREHFLSAQQLLNMKTSLTGQLGKRTRFQQHDIAQLILDVTMETEADVITVNNKNEYFPKDINLDDDTILNEIKFATPSDGAAPTLNCLQQAVIIALCTHIQKTTPPHMMRSEEIHAYLSVVLKQRQTFCWAGLLVALLLRCRLECNQRRRVERCMMQLEELSKSFTHSQPEAKDRLKLFHCLPLPPHWIIEHDLADCLVSLGCSHDALLIYERLKLWEGLILCLKNVGRLGKAEHIIREQLMVKETSSLWCHLGDITEDESCYQKAWLLSGQRSSRAQRSLGMLYLKKEKYEECINSLEKSLAISSLQEGVWFSLGHASLKVANHDLAVKSFRRCVLLDTDNAEAWNNLSAVHLKRNEKEKAFQCLQEAVKGCYDNWRIWENYLVVSIEARHYHEAISAYHRLLDLKDKFCDVEVLQHLVKNSCYSNDVSHHPRDSLYNKTLTLLARVTSQVTSNAEVWQLSAHMHLKAKHPSYEKVVMELQKALRIMKQPVGWEKNVDKCQQVVSLSLEYSQACREHGCTIANLSSARLCLQAILTTIKKNYIEPLPDNVDKLTRSLQVELEQLNICTSQLKAIQ